MFVMMFLNGCLFVLLLVILFFFLNYFKLLFEIVLKFYVYVIVVNGMSFLFFC